MNDHEFEKAFSRLRDFANTNALAQPVMDISETVKVDRSPCMIEYKDSASVLSLIEAVGSGVGIMNTDSGLFLFGHTYPKGTIFCIWRNKLFLVSKIPGVEYGAGK